MSKELQVVRQEDVPLALTPRQQVEAASEMASVLQEVVVQGKLSKNFGGEKDHLFYEAWATVGEFFSCSAQVEWSKPMWHNEKIIGWEARCNIVNSQGAIVSSSEAMCAIDEKNWKGRDQYALRSMAQTRACSKAFRQKFSWVAVLAGYSATPAEEMTNDMIKKSDTKKEAKDRVKPKPKAKDVTTNGEYLKAVAAFKESLGMEYYAILDGIGGYSHSNEIVDSDKQHEFFDALQARWDEKQKEEENVS